MAQESACHPGMVGYERQDSSSVRMIVLIPGKPEETLRATLESVHLETLEANKYHYQALSYTWSSEERVVDMILNEQLIKITPQLGELFLASRAQLTDDTIASWWVDQICINQDDDEDKAQQIPHMRVVYEKAAGTIIWLKPGFEDGDLVIDLILRLRNLSLQPESGTLLEQVPLSKILGPPTEENRRSWRALHKLMSHRYWWRTWILPEATACIDACFVVCLTFERALRIRELFWMRNFLRYTYLTTETIPPEYSEWNLQAIPSSPVGRVENFGIERSISGPSYTALFDLLQITRRTECNRPEDKIFSMLPFAHDVGEYMSDPFIRPSYAQGCDRTYSDLIKWYILKYRNLNFLGCCTATKKRILQMPGFDLPSWVPNWTHASFLRPLYKHCNPTAPIDDQIPLYRACGPFSYSIDIVEPPSTDFQANSLFLSGLRIAVVQKVLKPTIDGGIFDAGIEKSWQNEFDGDATYSLTAEPYHDAFGRTVVADVSHNVARDAVSRPGKVDWWHKEMSLSDKSDRDYQLKVASGDRRMFFARSSPALPDVQSVSPGLAGESSTRLGADCKSFLMGLGRSDVAVGDEIWALKGGQVLYVLRRRSNNHTVSNIADAPEPGWPSCPSYLWLNGKSHPWNAVLSGPSFGFVGECYVHGLMDGEALEIASMQPADRPELLKDIASDFQEIFVGGAMYWSKIVPREANSSDLHLDAHKKIVQEMSHMEEDSASTESEDGWSETWEVF